MAVIGSSRSGEGIPEKAFATEDMEDTEENQGSLVRDLPPLVGELASIKHPLSHSVFSVAEFRSLT